MRFGSGPFDSGVHRDLGVLIDRSLKFHGHIEAAVCRASGLANSLLRSTVSRSKDFMMTLFVSHIRPLLDYCSCVWNLGYEGNIRKLEGVQRRWTKQVTGMWDMSIRLGFRFWVCFL